MKAGISILGCGWLGLDLARALIASGFKVKGSTTTSTKLEILKHYNIEPYLISISELGIKGDFEGFISNSEILIIAVPPGLRKNPDKRYDLEMTFVAKALAQTSVKYILFIGSTSVFQDDYTIPVIYADTEPNSNHTNAKQLLAAERLFTELEGISTTILRFSGLIGDDRHPGYYLQGRKNLPNSEGPINLIHKMDCIGIIKRILHDNHWGKTWNAAFPKHPKRKAYYVQFCKQHELPEPTFASTLKSKGKIIDSTKMAQILDYDFKIEP
ncbi:hypothetical protein [uncultured Winogradskyella sp.]|uniref:hypothetical protein n=1 Tax=uncultured Winogradskyella sp. TaxID=395353 RepID=UPI00351220EC